MSKTVTTEQGQSSWIRQGAQSSNPLAPGSYGKYVRIRTAPKPYERTPQQEKIREAGRAIGKNCTGKRGTNFTTRRRTTLEDIFKAAPAKAQERMRKVLKAQTSPLSPTITTVAKSEVQA